MLYDLPQGAWLRTGIHEQNGPKTLLDVVTGLIEHEQEHCAQIEAICAALG